MSDLEMRIAIKEGRTCDGINPVAHICHTCGHVWQHGRSGEHSCTARMSDEMDRLESDLSAATSRLAVVEKERRSPYCPTCKACGEDGCCPPDKCKHLTCFYGADYAKSYKELEAKLAAAEASRDEMREALADLYDLTPTQDWLDNQAEEKHRDDVRARAHALVSRAESDAGESVTK